MERRKAVPVTVPNLDSRAACGSADPELFFPEGNSENLVVQLQIEAAKTVCRRCPVRTACLDWAEDTGQKFGVWGGTTEKEREAMRRRKQKLSRKTNLPH